MTQALVNPVAMPPKKVDVRKVAISVTLTASNLEELRAFANSHQFPPSVSQLLDTAMREYLDRNVKPSSKPRPK